MDIGQGNNGISTSHQKHLRITRVKYANGTLCDHGFLIANQNKVF